MENPISIFIMQANPFLSNRKSFMKVYYSINLPLTVLICSSEFEKKFRDWFESIWNHSENSIKDFENRKRKGAEQKKEEMAAGNPLAHGQRVQPTAHPGYLPNRYATPSLPPLIGGSALSGPSSSRASHARDFRAK
jgi:hypothetical protein